MKRFGTLLVLLCLLLALGMPAAAADGGYVFEETGGLLEADTIAALEQECAAAAELYDCGIYIVTLEDHRGYHEDAFEAAEEIYRSRAFGVGVNKNGILLMLSMSQRDFAMVSYGDIANSVFTDRIQDHIVDAFLDDFAEDDWEAGLRDFVETCTAALEGFDGVIGESYDGFYLNGKYYPLSYTIILEGGFFEGVWYVACLVLLPAPVLIARSICGHMKAKMNNTAISHTAEEYIPNGGVVLTKQKDSFAYSTKKRNYYSYDDDDDDNSDMTSVRSSGFSGRSGKF